MIYSVSEISRNIRKCRLFVAYLYFDGIFRKFGNLRDEKSSIYREPTEYLKTMKHAQRDKYYDLCLLHESFTTCPLTPPFRTPQFPQFF